MRERKINVEERESEKNKKNGLSIPFSLSFELFRFELEGKRTVPYVAVLGRRPAASHRVDRVDAGVL